MYSRLFRNRLVALALVVLVAIAALSFVGFEKHGGIAGKITKQVQEEKPRSANPVVQTPAEAPQSSSTAAAKPQPLPIEYLDDEGLIDLAEGFDPTPDETAEPIANPEQGDVTIIIPKQPPVQ